MKGATKEQINILPLRELDLEFLKEKNLASNDYMR